MKKIELSLKTYGQPILRKEAKPVLDFTSELNDTFNQILKVMYSHKGIGLAATQVGLDMQVAVIDIGMGIYRIANPKILKKTGTQISEEGCLSLPDIVVKLRRAEKILLEYQNERGKVIQLECDGLLSRAVQHEIDHLQGRLIIDYLPWYRRIKLRKKLEQIKKQQR